MTKKSSALHAVPSPEANPYPAPKAKPRPIKSKPLRYESAHLRRQLKRVKKEMGTHWVGHPEHVRRPGNVLERWKIERARG